MYTLEFYTIMLKRYVEKYTNIEIRPQHITNNINTYHFFSVMCVIIAWMYVRIDINTFICNIYIFPKMRIEGFAFVKLFYY